MPEEGVGDHRHERMTMQALPGPLEQAEITAPEAEQKEFWSNPTKSRDERSKSLGVPIGVRAILQAYRRIPCLGLGRPPAGSGSSSRPTT